MGRWQCLVLTICSASYEDFCVCERECQLMHDSIVSDKVEKRASLTLALCFVRSPMKLHVCPCKGY